jgi:ceramide glucosyltransferase
MIYIFFLLAVLLVWLSFKSFLGGIRYLGYFRRELSKPRSAFIPFVTVIAPCRGVDDGMEQNLGALLAQDYPSYEVIFVVDSERDPSVELIERISGNDARVAEGLKLVIAPTATDSAQKVANLREGVMHAARASEVFVFVDSDVRPANDWLRSLVAPLADEHVGAATGYRWFIAEHPSFASEIRSAWNASIASALGPKTAANFCWGGSMAIRRDTFEELTIRERLKGTLSDDFTITRVLNEAGRPVVFAPRALTASIGDCDFADLLEFTTRQMKITRVYATKLWLMSLVGSGLFNIVMIAAFLIVVLSRQNDLAVFVAFATLTVVAFFSIGKSWLRLAAVKLVLTEHGQELKRQSWTQNTLWLVTPALFFYNSVAALFSRTVTWRGIRYKLKSPTETVIISE